MPLSDQDTLILPFEQGGKAKEKGQASSSLILPFERSEPTPIVPSQPSVRPNLPYGQATSISAGKPYEPSLAQNVVGGIAKLLGVPYDPALGLDPERAKADALVQRKANEKGVPLYQYRNSPEMLEQFVGEFGNMMTLGAAPTLRKAILGTEEVKPSGSAGIIGAQLGSLAGLITGPGKWAGMALGGAIRFLPGATQEMQLSHRIIVEALRDSATLGTAMGASALGDAASQVTFSDAAGVIWDRMKSGAMTGALFGVAKGMFPKEGWEKGARLLSGLVMLNVQRKIEGGWEKNPFADRPVGEVLFDIGLDAFFLWKGLPKNQFDSLVKDVSDNVDRVVATNQKIEGLKDVPEGELKKAKEKKLAIEQKQNQLEVEQAAKKAAAAAEAAEKAKVKAEEAAKAKVKKAPETEEERKVRMAKVRAAGKVKVPTEEAKPIEPVVTPVEQPKPELLQTEIPKVMEQAEVPAAEPPVKKLTKPQQARVDKVKLLSAEGKDPGQIAFKMNMKEAEVRSILGMEPPKLILPGEKVEPVKPSEKIDYLSEGPKAKVEPKVRSKIEQTPPTPSEPSTGLVVTPSDMKALEAKFGPNWDELSDKEIGDFLATKPTEVKPAVEVPLVEERSDIEKYYNKDIEKITQSEFDKYFDLMEAGEVGVKTEPITNVDLQTGTPEPAELVGDDSIYSADKAATDARTKLYQNNKAVANNISELLSRNPVLPKDPGATAWKLFNDVNRWLHGEEVDIAGTRGFLSELAARADEFKDQFIGEDYPQSFYDWKEMISDGANWARKVDRTKIERTGQTLYSGVDPFKLYEGLQNWFSQLRKDAERKLPNKATGEQISNTLRKGVTQDEWNRSGLSKLLVAGQKYTKEEVIGTIDKNLPVLKDVVLDKEANINEVEHFRAKAREIKEVLDQDPTNVELRQQWKDAIGRIDVALIERDRMGPKFSSYVEPGGSNYKELFVTAPLDRSRYIEFEKAHPQPEYYSSELYYDNLKNSWIKDNTWQDGHPDYSDIENPIVRLRFNDRTDAQGNKVLFIEELQPPNPENQAKMPPEFVKRWREIGMKRAIKYAIDGGYDRVAWTTGEMQANRYTLERQVNRIDWARREPDEGMRKGAEGYYLINVTTKDGGVIDYYPKPNELSELVGKELAEKILSSDKKLGIIEGVDLKIGGQGIKKIYDQDLPNVARRLGGKVEEIKLHLGKDIDVSKIVESDNLWYVDQHPFPYPTREAAIRALSGDITRPSESSVPSFSLSPFKQSPYQPTLYSGIPVDKIKQTIKDIFSRPNIEKEDVPDTLSGALAAGRRGFKYMEDARKMKEFNVLEAAKITQETFTRAAIERSGNIARDIINKLGNKGIDVLQSMYLSRGGHPRATNMLEQMSKEVYNGLSRNELKIFDTVDLARRVLSIANYKTKKQFKPPKDMSVETSAIIDTLYRYKSVNGLENLTDEQVAKIERSHQAYVDWMKKALSDMYNEGQLITEEEYNNLVIHNYRKLGKVNEVYDRSYRVEIGGKKRTIYDSGVESLQRGKDTDILEPSSKVMALEVFNRAYGRIMHNKANLELLKLARDVKDNPFVRFKESKEDKIPRGFQRFFVYEKGQRKAIYLSPDMAKEWLTSSPEVSFRFAKVMRFLSGTPIVRTFATGIEWGFALANVPRDVMHLWYAARQFTDGRWEGVYNANLPVFALQLGKDVQETFSDAALRKGLYDDYMKYGGGMDLLTLQSRLFVRGRHLDSSVSKYEDFLGYFGVTSELATRLAIMNRVIKNRAAERGISYAEARKNPDILKDATFSARDYMDFSQGGSMIKAMDNVIPYLNASIVGTRSLMRAFKPGSGTALTSSWKLAQFGLLVGGATAYFYKENPETMEALKGNIAAQNNFVIPLGDEYGFEDQEGQMRYPFLKIPLDPGQKFFKTFFEAATMKWLGYDVDIDRVTGSLKQMSPVSGTELPPVQAAILGYVTNKDFWTNEDIWKKTPKPLPYPMSAEEFIPGQTGEVYTAIGEKTGLSPERIKYAAEELVTSGSMWSYLGGKAYSSVFGDLPKEEKEQHLAMTLSKIPAINRFFGVTNPYSKYAASITEAEAESATKRWIETRELDARINGYLYKGNVKKSEIFDYIRAQKDPNTQERLFERYVLAEGVKNLPNRSFWMRLQNLTTEARAKVFVDRMNKSSEAEKVQLNKEAGQAAAIGGILSDDFWVEVAKLRRK